MSLLLFNVLFLGLAQDVQGAWWDNNWFFKQPINVSVSSGTTAPDFAVELFLNSSNVGSEFDWSEACLVDDQSRIRFINASETAELDFFIEECSVAGENMSVWVEIDQPLTTSNYTLYMYYGNGAAAPMSNPYNTFDFYLNFSNVTIVSEGSGSGQDISGGADILDGGRTYNIYGNAWKVATSIPSYTLLSDSSQIFEVNMFASDCGEISGVNFDTDTAQNNANNYKFCGSQGYARAPDVGYTTLGVWTRIEAVLNDFTITPTHIHIVADDDGGPGSTNATYKDFRIRKHHTSDPTFELGSQIVTNVTAFLNLPGDNFRTSNETVEFTCSAVAPDGTDLVNLSLYGNWSGSWQLEDTVNISGASNSTNFTQVLPSSSGTYSWNCEVYGTGGAFDSGDDNRTIVVDKDVPGITINEPSGTVQDVTPRINVTANENLSELWYNVDGGTNITLCANCNSSYDQFLHLAEGSYTLNVYANDTVGNFNGVFSAITINQTTTFYETFDDNSSIGEFNDSVWNGGNISYSSASRTFYEGIEIGFSDTNINFIANQWNGGANAGEVDIVCPGGDSACWFTTQNGTNRSTLDIDFGVTSDDGDSSTVGFIMYSEENVRDRFIPPPHPTQGVNFVNVCFVSGQWYYDDNNGCDNPFTPRDNDVLLANLTWGITSISPISGTGGSGSTLVDFKSINLTSNITRILNISWEEAGTTVTENNISFEISVDNGITWLNTTINNSVKDFTPGNILRVRANMTSNGTQEVSFDNLNITWTYENIINPNVTLYTPFNSSSLVRGQLANFTWFIEDNDPSLNCTLYINGEANFTSSSCATEINISYGTTQLDIGEYNWTVGVVDSDGNEFNATNFTFTIERDVRPEVSKSIRSYTSDNMYLVTINVTNKAGLDYNGTVFDFVDTPEFVAGSFNNLYDDFYTINGSWYDGTIYYWNFTLASNESLVINYSIIGTVDDYYFEDKWLVGLGGDS